MKLSLGTIQSNFVGYNKIAGMAAATSSLIFDEVELNFSDCAFFDANMTAPLQTVISKLFDTLNTVSVTNLSQKIKRVLRKNKFLTIFDIEALPDNNQTTLPFKILKPYAGEQFSEYLDLYMKGRGIPKMTEALKKRFKQSLFEIFQNAAMHSEATSGIFICGQFYPNKQKLDFSIADAGIGIRGNVRRHLGNTKLSSCNAIKWAMREGNSTKRSGQPGGLGLKLLKDFIRINGGKLQIASRYGFYELSPSNESTKKMEHDFPGTCVNIEINTADTNTYCLKTELTVADIF